MLELPGPEARNGVELVLACKRFDLVCRRALRDELDQLAVLGHGGGAAVRDLNEHGAADRIEPARHVAQKVTSEPLGQCS